MAQAPSGASGASGSSAVAGPPGRPSSSSPVMYFASSLQSNSDEQLGRHRRQRLPDDPDGLLGRVRGQRADQVDLAPLRLHRRVVVAGVAAARLGPLQRGPRHALGDDEHVAQVEREVPAGVELPAALDADLRHPAAQVLQRQQRLLDLLGLADDADQVVHRLLQVGLDRVRVLAALQVERRQRRLLGRGHVRLVHGRPGRRRASGRTRRRRCRPAGRTPAGRTASCRRAGSTRACRRPTSPAANRPGTLRLLGVRVDLDAAHHVVAGRADLHRLGGDVDVGQLLELVVHRRQLAPDRVGRQPGGDVQEHAAVRRAAARP